MEKLRRQRSSKKRKILIYYLRDILTETPSVFSQEDRYIYIYGGKPPTSTSTSNMVLIDVVPLTSIFRLKH
jgi:hypothetical protein